MRDTIRWLEEGSDLRLLWAAGMTLCFAASWWPAACRGAALAALAVASSKLWVVFPHSSNHFALEWLCVLFASLVGRWDAEGSDAETLVFLRAARWLPVLVMIWSGLNKLAYGTYFNGAFLATVLPSAGFGTVFGLLLSPAEIAALLAAEPPGPYRFQAPLALAASNAVWAGEIVCGLLLLWPPARMLGLAGGVALLLAIELGAFEVLFGTLMLNLLGLFAPAAAWSRRLLAASALFYASLLAAKLGWLPAWSFN